MSRLGMTTDVGLMHEQLDNSSMNGIVTLVIRLHENDLIIREIGIHINVFMIRT